MRRPAVGNCGLREAKPPGAVGRSPARGLGKRSPQRRGAGRFVRLPPTDDGRGQGRWGSGRPAVENCGLREVKPPAAVNRSPREGAWRMEPATSSCRAFCATFTHGRWPRPRGVGPDTAGSWKLRPSVGRNRGGGWSQPPRGGLASEARNFQLPGVLCGFHPRAVAAAEGQCGSGAAGSWKLRPSVAKPPRAVGRSPREGAWQMKPATSSCRAFCAGFHPWTMAAARGRWARHGRQLKTAVSTCETARAVGCSPRRGLGK